MAIDRQTNEAIFYEVARILGQETGELPEVSPMFRQPVRDPLEEINDLYENPEITKKVGRKFVAVNFGKAGAAVHVEFSRRDPSQARVTADKSVSDEEILATSFLFRVIAARSGKGPFVTDPFTSIWREESTKTMLEKLGRADIVRAFNSSVFNSLPGIAGSNLKYKNF